MNFQNMLSAIDAPTDIIDWITVGIIILGMCLFFGDLIVNIKKRRNTRLNVWGLIFVSFAIVSFLLAGILPDMEMIFSLISIAFLICYFMCDIVIVVCIGRKNKREKQKRKENVSDSNGDAAKNSSAKRS